MASEPRSCKRCSRGFYPHSGRVRLCPACRVGRRWHPAGTTYGQRVCERCGRGYLARAGNQKSARGDAITRCASGRSGSCTPTRCIEANVPGSPRGGFAWCRGAYYANRCSVSPANEVAAYRASLAWTRD